MEKIGGRRNEARQTGVGKSLSQMYEEFVHFFIVCIMAIIETGALFCSLVYPHIILSVQ